MGRITSAYCVPEVSVGRLLKLAVKSLATPPLPNPAIVVDAMSAPVGRPPLVALSESVRLGVVPVQPLQNRLRSTRVIWPVTAGVNICPPQVVIVIPTPLVLRVVFC